MISVFVDTNIIISGIFFSGLEAEVLRYKDIKLVSADICREEALDVAERKFDVLSSKSLEKVLHEVEEALMDIDFIERKEYEEKIQEAESLVGGENDSKVLAAVLHVEPDHFITGDGDFDNEEVRKRVDLKTSRELLDKID
ncbi:MAG: PIN domain-containing protein [Thermoplasmatota archaeon]